MSSLYRFADILLNCCMALIVTILFLYEGASEPQAFLMFVLFLVFIEVISLKNENNQDG